MRPKWRALVIACLLLFALGGVSYAAGSTFGPVTMSGQLAVNQNGQTPSIQLTADATDGSGWHLQGVFTPVNNGRSQRADSIGLDGQFSLTGPGNQQIQGQGQGQINRNGIGSLQLIGADGQTQLNGSLSIDQSGAFQMTLSGQLGSASATTSATSAQTTGSNAFWYVTRAAGLTAYLLLFLNVCLGLEVRSHYFETIFARWQSFDLHQFTALLALGFVIVHVTSLLGDTFVKFSPEQVLIPFASPYRPVWTAFGVFSLYLIIVVTASFYLRRIVGYHTFRALHYLTFAIFVMVLVHGLYSGTDSTSGWAKLLYWTTGFIVLALLIRRLGDSEDKRAARATDRRRFETARRP